MSDNKKYYYMRLVENYFDRTELKIIRQMPKGAEYLLILLKMSCRSFARAGMLMVTDRIPYNDQTLAASLEEDINDVRAAINVFVEFGLIEVLEGNIISINDVDNYIGESSSNADKRRTQRKKKAESLLPGIQNNQQITSNGTTNVGQMLHERQMSPIEEYRESLEIENRDKPRARQSASFEPYIPPKQNPTKNLYDSMVTHWNSKGNLVKALSSLNNPEALSLCNIISEYGEDYVKQAIDNLSENIMGIESKYRPGSLTKFLKNSVGYWAELKNEEQESANKVSATAPVYEQIAPEDMATEEDMEAIKGMFKRGGHNARD